MSIYTNYVAPGIRYLTYITFLITIVMFAFQVRKIYQSNCRIMVFDALGKPFVPAMIFLILFFWKNINEFVTRSALVGGEKKTPSAPVVEKKTPSAPEPAEED
jgi:hypothetical protein